MTEQTGYGRPLDLGDLYRVLSERDAALAAVQRVRELANWHKTHSHDAHCYHGCAYSGFIGNQILRALEGEQA